MAQIKADSGKLWDYYMVLANVKADGDSECEEMIKNLNKIMEQIDHDCEACEAEISDLQSKIEQEKKKKQPDQSKISQWKMQIDELKQHILTMRSHKKTAKGCVTKVQMGQKKYADAMRGGMKYVSSFLNVLDSVLGQNGGSGDGSQATGGGLSRMTFRGHTVYCSDSAFSVNESNLQRMEQGYAPLGSDGLPVNLHHMQQSDSGSFMELTQTTHKQYDKPLHINKGSGIPSGINRSGFGVLKRAYWKKRAAILRQRGGL